MGSEALAAQLLQYLPRPWKVTDGQAAEILPMVVAALEAGWTQRALYDHLIDNPGGITNHWAVLCSRLRRLPVPPATPTKPGPGTAFAPPVRDVLTLPEQRGCGRCDGVFVITDDDGPVRRCNHEDAA